MGTNNLDSSSELGLIGPGIDHPAMHQMLMPNLQVGVMGSGASDSKAQQLPISNFGAAKLETVSNNCVPQSLNTSNLLNKGQEHFASYRSHLGEMDSTSNSPQASMLMKRKAPVNEPQKLLMPNKRLTQVEHRPWLQQVSPSSKYTSPSHSLSNAAASPRLQASSKRPQSWTGPQQPQAPPKQSAPSKTGTEPDLFQKNRVGQTKVQNESFDSVRSKLRDSLASALALAVQNKDNTSSACVGKSSKSKAADRSQKMQEKSQSPEQPPLTDNVYKSLSGEAKEGVPAKNENWGDDQRVSKGVFNSSGNSEGKEFQSIITISDGDASFSDSFFAKDEFLQGNGLAWALESDVGLTDKKDDETQDLSNQDDGGGHDGGRVVQTPEVLASKIEEELFKLFGGVNKKYKEKGRSLLFNLKDRNNPELGERVVSGEIPPERLCSMTAEELASKELSEWRIAKAEELAQMVVLPDTQVDIRRLVKKTHKGEFQVEVEEPDAISVDVAVGTSLVMEEKAHTDDEKTMSDELKTSEPSEVKVNKEKANSPDEKTNLVKQDTPCTLTIPSNEGTDLMQGLMVDDELKDAEFLPPIVSLDEFMESLNSEPPFELLPHDAEGRTPSDGVNKEVEGESKPLASNRKALVNTSADKPDNTGLKKEKPDADTKPIDSRVKSLARSLGELKGERVWDGQLQLNISALAAVIGIFKSGEKTSAKDWPSLIEVKGRVRLDAFGKFLQELPMSRSRAVMVLHFVCKDGLAESEYASISEVAESYVSDGRVGFAEPAPGVELYVCPPHGKTCEMLGNVLPKDRVNGLNHIDNGLIGVVVWRKVITTISPRSASDNKHNSKKQLATPRRHQEKDSKVNVNVTSKPPSSSAPSVMNSKSPIPPDEDDDDDDVPPGFGPLATRDEDDLPEFNFANGSNIPRAQFSVKNSSTGLVPKLNTQSQHASRPVDEIRQLIHKYGQTANSKPSSSWPERRGLGMAAQPWNDDDDDMPEWQPEPQLQQAHVQQPLLRPHLVPPVAQQQMLPAMHLQNGTWTPTGSHLFPVHHPNVGHFYGVPPGHAPASRGF